MGNAEMKKLLAVLIALSMLLLFAGCGGTDDSKPDDTTTAVTATTTTTAGSSQPPKGYLEIFTSGTYHMRTRAADQTITETFAQDGMKASLTEVNGIPARTVLRDGKMYIITDSRRIALVTDRLDSAPTDVGTAIAAAASSPLGEGTADFAGRTLPYEEYGTAGSKVQCFLHDGRLAGVRTISGGKTIDTEILLLDQTISASRLEIPDFYTQITT